MRFKYTAEQIQFLQNNIDMTLAKVTEAFNDRFSLQKGSKALCSFYKNHKLHRVRPKGPGKGNGKARMYTPEQTQFIRDNYTGRSVAELTFIFNSTFGTDRTWQQIKTFVRNRGIVSGRTGRFEKGSKSWNKGVKGCMGANVTSFKKGNEPPNRKHLYSERIDSKNGFILIKVPERNPYTMSPTRYKYKHVWVWEQANGPVPEACVVVFKDSNKLNCELDNLMLLTRAELLTLNLHGYKEMPSELKPSILFIAKIEAKAGFRMRPGRGRQKETTA